MGHLGQLQQSVEEQNSAVMVVDLSDKCPTGLLKTADLGYQNGFTRVSKGF